MAVFVEYEALLVAVPTFCVSDRMDFAGSACVSGFAGIACVSGVVVGPEVWASVAEGGTINDTLFAGPAA